MISEKVTVRCYNFAVAALNLRVENIMFAVRRAIGERRTEIVYGLVNAGDAAPKVPRTVTSSANEDRKTSRS
jgi:hypothetical protein